MAPQIHWGDNRHCHRNEKHARGDLALLVCTSNRGFLPGFSQGGGNMDAYGNNGTTTSSSIK